MQVDSAILADFVQENHGKLYITGGGIDTLFANAVPVRHPSLGIAFRLTLSPAELGRPHQLEILLVNADGGRLATVTAKIQADRPPQGTTGWPVSVPLAINFANIEFPTFGDYQFDLMVNNSSIKDIRFRVVPAPSVQKPV
ncbi:MAG: hypothetical protein HZC18_06995 [Candidatus Omnitrophica bacterium]|nr:hypothetical protein [Candidatus Omnitrophota bacterium]